MYYTILYTHSHVCVYASICASFFGRGWASVEYHVGAINFETHQARGTVRE